MSLGIPTINEWEPNSVKDVQPPSKVADALCLWDYAASSAEDKRMCNISNLYYNS
jgi:hypothetical protein